MFLIIPELVKYDDAGVLGRKKTSIWKPLTYDCHVINCHGLCVCVGGAVFQQCLDAKFLSSVMTDGKVM